MTVLFSAELNSGASPVFSLFDETKVQKDVRSAFIIILVSGSHFRRAGQMLQEETGLPGVNCHLCLNFIRR